MNTFILMVMFIILLEANHDYDKKQKGGAHLTGKKSFSDNKYNFNGKYNCFISDNSDYGYKIFNFTDIDPTVTNLSEKIKLGNSGVTSIDYILIFFIFQFFKCICTITIY